MKQIKTLADFNHVFFIGIAGTGMSALAQYLNNIGKVVSGSDRYFNNNDADDIRLKLVAENIKCFKQNEVAIDEKIQLVVASAAIEDTVPEMQQAKALQIPVLKRSKLLSMIADSKRTIAVAGTSGKSTTSAMLFQILEAAKLEPGIISGAGLVSLIKQHKIGNAKAGSGEWLIIEADESDGSIVQYHPEVGILLNIDKDHQEIAELLDLFTIFKQNTKEIFIVNQSNPLAKGLSKNIKNDFAEEGEAGYVATDFKQNGLTIQFKINGVAFNLQQLGRHNMQNALAATAAAVQVGVSLEVCAKALESYEGIYRRHQILLKQNNVWLIDDYAHNPAKCAASIAACQTIAPKVIAWFQPHGYGPTRFLRNDFVKEITAILRTEDEMWMSEIFYAGGTAVKNISANDLITDIKANNKNAFFVEDRNDFFKAIESKLNQPVVILLMGARDPSLEHFAAKIKIKLENFLKDKA